MRKAKNDALIDSDNQKGKGEPQEQDIRKFHYSLTSRRPESLVMVYQERSSAASRPSP